MNDFGAYRQHGDHLDGPGLARLLETVESGTPPRDWPGDTEWRSWRCFEYLVLRGFERELAAGEGPSRGAVVWPYTVSIRDVVAARGSDHDYEQIDGCLHVAGLSCLLEMKAGLADSISGEPVAKLRNQLLRRPAATIGALFSVSGFTEAATVLARFCAPQCVLLWNLEDLRVGLECDSMLEGLLAKWRHMVERGVPDLDLREALATTRQSER